MMPLLQVGTASLCAAAAKSLQSWPTLCDPRDGSPPGSPLPGILQAYTQSYGFSSGHVWMSELDHKEG